MVIDKKKHRPSVETREYWLIPKGEMWAGPETHDMLEYDPKDDSTYVIVRDQGYDDQRNRADENEDRVNSLKDIISEERRKYKQLKVAADELYEQLKMVQAFHGVSRDWYRDLDGELYELDTSPVTMRLENYRNKYGDTDGK